MPTAIRSAIGLWSVCCPTPDHSPVLRAILAKDPEAHVLLEKPACEGHEIDAYTALLASHCNARVLVTDLYQHAHALDILAELMPASNPTPHPTTSPSPSPKTAPAHLQRRFIENLLPLGQG